LLYNGVTPIIVQQGKSQKPTQEKEEEKEKEKEKEKVHDTFQTLLHQVVCSKTVQNVSLAKFKSGAIY